MSKQISKCDVIIPVYNAPDWVKLCIYSLFVNTPRENLGKVYLMNDNSNVMTLNCLYNLKEKYGDAIEIITNKENLGFIKNVNKGLKLSSSKYVLLLNSDCLLSKNSIPKLISHMKKDKEIGLLSPISSNAANLTLNMFEGFGYTQMDALLEKNFLGKNFDACTITGNCLMITRECIKRVGLLDTAYGMGYGEETDYQFKAMKEGFKDKVAIDTYVYHKAEASFGKSKEKTEKLQKNKELFFSRWGQEYAREAEKYSKNEPIEYINEHLTEKDKKINVNTLFYLPEIIQNAGGCHMVIDIVNYLIIKGFNAGLLYERTYKYKEPLLFNPVHWDFSTDFKTRNIVATIWISVFRIYSLIKSKKIPLINFVQGYENYFENGAIYNSVSLTHKIADDEIVISNYLKNKIKKIFGYDSTVIKNGINYDLMKHKNSERRVRRITFVMRNNMMKGDYILADIIKQIDNEYKDLEFNVIYMSRNIELPFVKNNKMNKILGPIKRLEIIELLQNTDLYVDASVNEGFGLIGLEAMACGAVPIMSNSFGINEYLINGENGYIVNEVNNSDKYMEMIREVLEDEKIFHKMKNSGQERSKLFDYDNRIDEYIGFLRKETEYYDKNFSREELGLIKKWSYIPVDNTPRGLSIIKSVNKFIPKFIRNGSKRIINWLYSLYEKNK